MTLKICAIRETFEESGLLLTTPPAHTVPELDTEVWRHRVHEDASQFKSMCDLYHLQPAVDRLIPFANWITPAFEKKRFNTLFFLTVLQQTVDGQQQETIKVSADGKETVQMDWFDPQQGIKRAKAYLPSTNTYPLSLVGLDKYEEKKIVLFPPQWYALHSLNQVPRHENLVAQVGIGALRTQAGDPITIRPQGNPVTESDYNGFLAYPGDEAYSTAQEDTSKDYVHLPPGRKGDRHRLYFKGKMQDVALERNVDITKLSNMAHL